MSIAHLEQLLVFLLPMGDVTQAQCKPVPRNQPTCSRALSPLL